MNREKIFNILTKMTAGKGHPYATGIRRFLKNRAVLSENDINALCAQVQAVALRSRRMAVQLFGQEAVVFFENLTKMNEKG
jgi:hypothetical protein